MKPSMRWRIDTKVVRGPREETDPLTGSHRTPIYQTSTFVFESAEAGAEAFQDIGSKYIYTRLGNPTIDFLEEKLAFLESAESGAAFASGMAAVSSVIFSLAKPGDEIIVSSPLYGGTKRFLSIIYDRFGILSHPIKPLHFQEELKRRLDEKIKFVFIETPANPTLDIIDIEKTAHITKEAGIPLICDNTFATPFLQRPIEMGADIVVHSLTKYLSGHGDTIGGAVVGKSEYIKYLKEEVLFDFGGVISPFNAWLVLRGLKTLSVRIRKHSENALKVSEFLSKHSKVERVFYPGLASHPQYEIAKRQMIGGFSGMVSFIIKGGREAGKKLMNSVHLSTLAVSLGDTDTLIEHPASMTHSTCSEEELKNSGIEEGLIRLSVGIEDPEDIIEDLDSALGNV